MIEQIEDSFCTVTSSALVGSSAISKSGFRAMAMAISTRCFIPPESWCGYWSKRCSGWLKPTFSSRAITCCRRSVLLLLMQAEYFADLRANGLHRVQRVAGILRHRLILAPRRLSSRLPDQRLISSPLRRTVPASRRAFSASRPIIARAVVVFPNRIRRRTPASRRV